MMWVISRPPLTLPNLVEARMKKEWWCVYASGDRWNSRQSHAKVFSTRQEAETKAMDLKLVDWEVEVMK